MTIGLENDGTHSRFRIPKHGLRGAYLKQKMQDKLIEHKHFIDEHGEHLAEIRNWQWGSTART